VDLQRDSENRFDLAAPVHALAYSIVLEDAHGARSECSQPLDNRAPVFTDFDASRATAPCTVRSLTGQNVMDAWLKRSSWDTARRTTATGDITLPVVTSGWLVGAPHAARQRVRVEAGTHATVALEPATTAVLELVDEQGNPLAHGRVQVPELALAWTADAAGRVACDELPQDRSALSLVICGSRDEYLSLPFPAGPQPERICVPRGPCAEGRVLRANDTPVPNTIIRCLSAEDGVLTALSQTDPMGRFRLPAIAPGRYLLLALCAQSQASLECTIPSPTPLTLLMSEAATTVQCVSNANIEVSEATVALLLRGGVALTTQIDAAGQAQLPRWPQAELLVQHGLHEDLRTPLPNSSAATLTLQARRRLEIRALAAEGATALQSFTSALRTTSKTVLWSERLHTGLDSEGRVALLAPKGFSVEPLELTLSAPGRAAQHVLWDHSLTALSVAFALAAPVSGRIQSALSGAALEGAIVQREDAQANSVQSDRDGRFAIADLPRTACRLRITKNGFVAQDLAVPATTSPEARDLGVVRLLAAGRMEFRGPDGPLPLPATVRIEHLADGTVRECTFEKGSVHEFRDIQTGLWIASLRTVDAALNHDHRIVSVESGLISSVQFMAHRGRATILGTVSPPEGAFSVAGLIVRAHDHEGSTLAEAACTREGHFTLENLPLSNCRVEAALATAQGEVAASAAIQLHLGENHVQLNLTRRLP
jgi:hypothetical protein